MDKNTITLAKQWLKKANNDLLTVENNLEAENKPLDMICFHCQQAVEKFLKAFLLVNNKPILRTHDLLFLLEKVNEITDSLESYREKLAILNVYSVEIRYPDDFFEPSLEDVEEAENIAIMIKKWLKKESPILFDKE